MLPVATVVAIAAGCNTETEANQYLLLDGGQSSPAKELFQVALN